MEESLKCYKCGKIYEDSFAGFYWESRRGTFRRPCKRCISEYNARPDQNSRRKRTAAEYYYLKVKRENKNGKKE
jgi:hypothetical protein